MNPRFRRGLVVGKFAPLHAGHEFLVRAALARCDEVLLISYSLPELPGCEPEKRERWLAAQFPECRVLVATPARVCAWQTAGRNVAAMPPNDADDEAHRLFVARLCTEIMQCTVDAVFTSEAYGDGLAASLSRHFAADRECPVVHVSVDPARRAIPVSGTAVRASPHANRHFLAPAVYADFVERVCLLGGESTGKSSLAQALASSLHTRCVAEYGRACWHERGGKLAFEDMLHIGRTQVAWEDAAAGHCNRVLVCDTSPLTTWLYSRHLFDRIDPELDVLAGRHYDHTFLCAPDFPFVQDGTRASAEFRARQHRWYLEELSRRRIAFTLLTGTPQERLSTALSVVCRSPTSRNEEAKSGTFSPT